MTDRPVSTTSGTGAWMDILALTPAGLVTGWEDRSGFVAALCDQAPASYSWPSIGYWQFVLGEAAYRAR